ncbi:MAG: glycosyltransferase [Cyclobacteriaceae bacterium]
MKPQVVKLATYIHYPFDTRIFVKQASTLHRAGYDVSIVVPHTKNETVDGVNIIVVEQYASGFKKLFFTPLDILSKAIKRPITSIFHIHDAQLVFIGIVLRLLGRKVIYDAHEDTYRQTMYQHWIPFWLKLPYACFYSILERTAGLLFNQIIIAEPIIGRIFPKKKTTLVCNFPIASSFDPPEDYQNRESSVVYVGLISEARGALKMTEAIDKANASTDCKLVLGGKFSPESLKDDVLESRHVDYLGWLGYEQLLEQLYQSRIGIIIPEANSRYTTNYPVKLFEYMCAALPVIASKVGESAKFVLESNCGILVDPENIDEISEAISYLINNPKEAEEMGRKGRNLIKTKYNWENEAQKLLSVYDRLI